MAYLPDNNYDNIKAQPLFFYAMSLQLLYLLSMYLFYPLGIPYIDTINMITLTHCFPFNLLQWLSIIPPFQLHIYFFLIALQ